MERPVRKPNRLREYDYSQQGCYFVTICTRGREHLLGHVAVGADVLIGPRVSLSKTRKNRGNGHRKNAGCPKICCNAEPCAYFTPNFRAGRRADGDIGPYAKSVPSDCSVFEAGGHEACGENIWQRGYHDHIVRNDADYLRVWDYIETNPAKWREDRYYCPEEGR